VATTVTGAGDRGEAERCIERSPGGAITKVVEAEQVRAMLAAMQPELHPDER
jgi:hypothetical protein